MGAFSYKCFLKIKLRGAFRMKKTLKKISAASLVVILSITLVACEVEIKLLLRAKVKLMLNLLLRWVRKSLKKLMRS